MMKVRIMLFLLLASLTVSDAFAKQKDPEKLYQKALRTTTRKAIPILEESAEMNYLPAQEMLAGIYLFDFDIVKQSTVYGTPNANKGFLWSSRAAEQGSFIGKACLANCYDRGIGTSVDHDKAIKMWIPAVEQFDGRNQQQKDIMMKCLPSFYEIERNWHFAVRRLKKEFENDIDRIYVVDMICYKFGFDFMTDKEKAEAQDKRTDDLYIKDEGMIRKPYFYRSYIYGHPKGSENFMREVGLKRAWALNVYRDVQSMEEKLRRYKGRMEDAVKDGIPGRLPEGYEFIGNARSKYPRLRQLTDSIRDFFLVSDYTFLTIDKHNYEGIFSPRNTSQDIGFIVDALKICMNEKRPDYRHYYEQCAIKLNDKLQTLSKIKADVRAEIDQELESFIANLNAKAAREAFSGSSSSSTSSSNGNSVRVPDIVKVERGAHGRKSDKDYDYLDDDTYVFDDGTRIKVFHRYREGGGHTSFLSLGDSLNYFYPSNLTSKNYETAEDAARAGWVWKKEELIRTIGAIKD